MIRTLTPKFICLLVLGCSLLINAEDQTAQKDSLPNIVLIMADDLGYECIGCNGGLSYKTPNLDRLASIGIRFTNCHSQPLCTPTRNQIMTGKYNFRNYENFEYLAPNQKTFAHFLQDAGYATCIAGKWQLNGRNFKRKGRENPARPQDSGFDQSCLWQVTALGQRYKNPELEINGEMRKLPGKYGPDICVDFITEFIGKNKHKPFLVYYPMILPHGPFVQTPDSEDWAAGKKTRTNQQYFAEMVQYVDKLAGRIEGSLKKNGVLDNTLFIFTGDNGTTRGLVTQTRTGPVNGAKGQTIDTGTHVPLIVSWPNNKSGSSDKNKPRVCDDLIDFSDVLPTLVQAAGKSLPGEFVCDGVSFLPQLRGEPGNPRKHIYCFYDPVWSNNVNQYRNRFARNKKFKVYRNGKAFDVTKDPLEKKPIDVEEMNDSGREQIEYLESVIDHFDHQGAAESASLLAAKVRPGTKNKRANKNKKKTRKK